MRFKNKYIKSIFKTKGVIYTLNFKLRINNIVILMISSYFFFVSLSYFMESK